MIVLVVGVFYKSYQKIDNFIAQAAMAEKVEEQAVLVSSSFAVAHGDLFRAVSWIQGQVEAVYIEEALQRSTASLEDASTTLAELKNLLGAPEQKTIATLSEQYERYAMVVKDAVEWLSIDNFLAMSYLTSAHREYLQLAAEADKLASRMSQEADRVRQLLETTRQSSLQSILMWSALGLLVSLLAALIIGFAISRPIKSLAESIEHIADGNLDVEVRNTNQRDEIGTMAKALSVKRISQTTRRD